MAPAAWLYKIMHVFFFPIGWNPTSWNAMYVAIFADRKCGDSFMYVHQKSVGWPMSYLFFW